MNENYNIELEKLYKEFMEATEIALKEQEKLYEEMKRKLGGSTTFWANSINRPTKECYNRYRMKVEELNKKYNM